jgi:hypothetical protein
MKNTKVTFADMRYDMKSLTNTLFLTSNMIFIIVTVTVVAIFIQSQFLNYDPLLAQNITLSHGDRNLTDLMIVAGPIINKTSITIQKHESPLSIVENMRGTEENLTTTKTYSVTPNGKTSTNNTYYTFSNEKSELKTPENNTHSYEFGAGIKVAVVIPTFTAAAYRHSFYVFYQKYALVPHAMNVTTDLNLLSSKIPTISTVDLASSSSARSSFTMLSLLRNLKWLTGDSNITVLTDTDVDNGSIFTKDMKSNAYNIVILGHQEYVTQQEYDNLRKFVANGGTMIILDGNVFFAQVKFNKSNQMITLVKGHSWAYNGKSAWKSVNERWRNETATWVGSNYLCYKCVSKFVNDPFGYKPHEEQYITNPNDIILLNYNASLPSYLLHKKPVIASYELGYKKGRVIALGIYSDDIISNGKFQRYLDSLLLQYDIKVRD